MATKSTLRICVLVFCFLLHVTLVTNNRMIMWATPVVVFSELTPSLNLTCIVGHELKAGTFVDMPQILSISIHRATETKQLFGSVRLYMSTPKRGWALPASASVQGNIPKPGSNGFFQVIWPNPTFANHSMEEFKCTAHGFSGSGHMIDAFTNVVVEFKLPSISTLLPFVQNLLSKVRQINATIESDKAKALAKIPHVEGGKINCKGDCGCRQIRFQKPYHVTPNVAYAPARLDIPHNDNIRLKMYVHALTKDSFRLCGVKWQDTKMSSLNMVWISFGL